MTRQDYELIARVVAQVEPNIVVTYYCGDERDRPNVYMRDRLAGMFADELAQTNPQFDRARFLKACGVSS